MGIKTPEIDLRDSLVGNNLIINGDMRVGQRGASFAAIASGAYSLDRWVYEKVGAMVHTILQDTDVPTFTQSGYLFQNSLRMNLTTPDDSIAAGDVVVLSHRIEGYNFAKIAQKPITLSFWVKSTTAGTRCVSVRNVGDDRSYVAEYTINSPNTWEKKVINVAASPSTGTWNYSNGIGLKVTFTLTSGSTYQTTANAWQTGNFVATANQGNGTATGNTDFRITGVMLNEGSEALPFSLAGRDYTEELALCQRYYETGSSLNAGFADSTSLLVSSLTYYKVTKRVIPTLNSDNFSDMTWSQPTIFDAGLTFSAILGNLVNGFSIRTNNPNSRAAGSAGIMGYNWTSNAEL